MSRIDLLEFHNGGRPPHAVVIRRLDEQGTYHSIGFTSECRHFCAWSTFRCCTCAQRHDPCTVCAS